MPTNKADAKGEPKEKRTYVCKRCIKAGVPEADVTFVGFDTYGKHLREHKLRDRIDDVVSTRLESQAPIAAEVPAATVPIPVRKPTKYDHDLSTLRGVLADAGIGARLDSIVTAFSDWDDLAELDRLMSMAGAMVHAKRMSLLVWAQHRGISADYVHKRYPTTAPVPVTATAADPAQAQPVTAEKKEDPFDSMMVMMEKNMKLQMMQQQMRQMQAGMMFSPDGKPVGEMPKPADPVMEMLNKQVQVEMLQAQLQQMRAGVRLGTDGKPVGEPEEKKTMREISDGSAVKMTDREWVDYQVGLEQRKTQVALQTTKEETKRESDKIPIMIDGKILNVPSDQVDKYIMLKKSMEEPDQKKDVYTMMQEADRLRNELQQQHQTEMQGMREKETTMVLQRQEQMITQLQNQIQQRPNPIAEMVSTQTELKEAGILAEGTKDVDQHNMAIQEKKLDTTMNLILQQQSAMNQKTNQLISVIGPIAQEYARKAADNLPGPGEARESFREKRKGLAQEVMPLDEGDAAAMEQDLETFEKVDEGTPPPKKLSRVLTVGDAR